MKLHTTPVQLFVLSAVALTIGFSSVGCSSYDRTETKCHESRGAMDVGSGSTKIKVAIVDTCALKVLKILAEDQVAISFKENISQEGLLPEAFLQEARDKILALSDHAVQNGIPLKDIAVVATQAARDAKNIDQLTKLLAEKNLKFVVISQQEEAELGHKAAALASQLKQKDFTSFDIGGGSFQLVNANGGGDDDGGRVQMLGGHLASVSFKNHVLTKIQNRSSSQSPNPIRPKHATTAIKYAADYANRLKQSGGQFEIKMIVVGIGGVFGSSIRNQMGLSVSESVHIADLEKLIPKMIGRSPKELSGPFADTESTNLLLVYGLMKGLGIAKVQIFKANLTDGVLVNRQFFRRLVN